GTLQDMHRGIGIENRHAFVCKHLRHGGLTHADRAGQTDNHRAFLSPGHVRRSCHLRSSFRNSSSWSSGGDWPKKISNATAAWPISIDRPSIVSSPRAFAAFSNPVLIGA